MILGILALIAVVFGAAGFLLGMRIYDDQIGGDRPPEPWQ